jgi:hypothetical protein
MSGTHSKIIINVAISDTLLDYVAATWPAANQIERSNRHYVFDITALNETDQLAMYDYLTSRLVDIL